jgi:phosphoglycolate phosphatase-like HAD superfamily hydrolase
MNLVMLDIDGTLTQSYEYDLESFGLAIGEVLGCPPISIDLNDYVDKTSLGVTLEAIQRLTGRNPQTEDVNEVKRRVLCHLERIRAESPGAFCEVPGASRFIKRIQKLKGVGIAIATGCWRDEALFKLQASSLDVDGIPMATSDDNRNRMRIMQIAVDYACHLYSCPDFEHIVYIGDGIWDMQASHSLGYGFVGIGSRLLALRDDGIGIWHSDYQDIEAVLSSLRIVFK